MSVSDIPPSETASEFTSGFAAEAEAEANDTDAASAPLSSSPATRRQRSAVPGLSLFCANIVLGLIALIVYALPQPAMSRPNGASSAPSATPTIDVTSPGLNAPAIVLPTASPFTTQPTATPHTSGASSASSKPAAQPTATPSPTALPTATRVVTPSPTPNPGG